MNRRRFLGGLVGAGVGSAAAAAGVSRLGSIGKKSVKEAPPAEIAAAARRRSRFLNVALHTHENKEVRFYDDLIKGKTVLINFMFTSCEDDCPLNTANLRQVQKLLGDRVGRDIFFYSITLDPEHDTPEVLKEYAQRFGAKPGWLFLTGETGDIERLRKSFGFVDPDPVVDADKEQHLNMCWMGIEPLERWSACPTLTRPSAIARYISWAEPKGERPDGSPRGRQA